ncbi:uncharacterized protein si:dkey-262k9.2 [Hoplias malabaricus]|uniref:uncharacterized protein si:dkey-262k9.2 n=1 Tax=Hoplias malabaricus TaxID=27720 RepID=UPI003461B329
MRRRWKEPKANTTEQLWVCAVGEEEEGTEQYFPGTSGASMPFNLSHLSAKQQKELRKVIPPKLFSEEPGKTSIIQHDIRLLKSDPIRQTNCRVPASLIPDLKKEFVMLSCLYSQQSAGETWAGVKFHVEFQPMGRPLHPALRSCLNKPMLNQPGSSHEAHFHNTAPEKARQRDILHYYISPYCPTAKHHHKLTWKMLRLFLLCLILTATTATSEDDVQEGSGDDDDEPGDDEIVADQQSYNEQKVEAKQSKEEGGGPTTIIIIAAVSLIALAIFAVLAIVLFKRHLHAREQGEYTVPTDQEQKVSV